MPLSEHEQRLLEQIEQSLYADDPKFASAVRSIDLRTHNRRRLVRCALLFVVGLGLLLAGVVAKIIPLGVAGFVVMLVAVALGVSVLQRIAGRRRPARAAAPKVARGGLRERLEERWQRRWQDRGQ